MHRSRQNGHVQVEAQGLPPGGLPQGRQVGHQGFGHHWKWVSMASHQKW